MRLWVIVLLSAVLAGCAGQKSKPFDIKTLAKSDIDMVSDLHRKHLLMLSRELTLKLYKRNPKELHKSTGTTLDRRLEQIFPPVRQDNNHQYLPRETWAELNNKDSVDAIELAFDPVFQGDRVFALMIGITGMIDVSYDHQQAFYLTSKLDAQKIYTCARNLERVAFLLRTRMGDDGQPMLLSNGATAQGVANLSYERLFGKMIANQDLLAEILADSTNRTINRVVHGAASMTLLPI